MATRYELLLIFPGLLPTHVETQRELVKAYVDSNEGIDRAGGFAIQVDQPGDCASMHR